MTCIVGLVHEGIVYIGGDSAGVDGNYKISIRKDKKVFKNGSYIMGFTSSFRMGQILMCNFIPPEPNTDENANLYKFIVRKFIPSLRREFKDGGFSTIHCNVEDGGFFLVGIKGRLFEIQNDFQVAETYDHYESIGCGADLAKGSLFSTRNRDMKPEDRINLALEAASHFSAGVAAPFNIIDTKGSN